MARRINVTPGRVTGNVNVGGRIKGDPVIDGNVVEGGNPKAPKPPKRGDNYVDGDVDESTRVHVSRGGKVTTNRPDRVTVTRRRGR